MEMGNRLSNSGVVGPAVPGSTTTSTGMVHFTNDTKFGIDRRQTKGVLAHGDVSKITFPNGSNPMVAQIIIETIIIVVVMDGIVPIGGGRQFDIEILLFGSHRRGFFRIETILGSSSCHRQGRGATTVALLGIPRSNGITDPSQTNDSSSDD